MRILLFMLLPVFAFGQIPPAQEIPIFPGESGGDAFGRLRVSNSVNLFDGQFTYDLQPLLFDTLKTSNADIQHDSINRNVELSLTNAGATDTVAMQTYECFRYQPGKSQLIFVTFNMIEAVDSCLKAVGYTDGENNGYEFIVEDGTAKFRILSNTSLGDTAVAQTNWNIDKMDGTGKSQVKLDLAKSQILVVDFEALYVGRVRFGFNIDGKTYYAHQFTFANKSTAPYVQTANLPIRAYMIPSGSDVSTTMDFNCASVTSEGGNDENYAYTFAYSVADTAGDDSDAHIMSIRPLEQFNGYDNRFHYDIEQISILNEGTNDVFYQVVLGQAITSPTLDTANANYSGIQVLKEGTLSGSPAIVIDADYIPAGERAGVTISAGKSLTSKYPVTLDMKGNHRDNGTITILAKGIGGTSEIECTLKWKEIR